MNPNGVPPLIPRKVLFDNPDKAMTKLSPDGNKISYLAPVDGVLNVWVGSIDDLDSASPVTHDTGRGIRFYSWSYTNQHILYGQDKDGDENWRIYCVDLATGETRDMTPYEGVQARIEKVSPHFPNEILIGINQRNPQLHDLYRLDLTTGQKELLLENEGFVGFITDLDYQIRFGMRVTPDGGAEVFQRQAEEWQLFTTVEMEDTMTTQPIVINEMGNTLYMVDSRGRDTAALLAHNLDNGEQTVLAQNDQCDVNDAMIHPTQRHIQAVAFTHERKTWQILDRTIAEDLAYLQSVADGEVEVVDRTLDDQQWIVAYLMDDGPARYYRYDRAAQETHFLFTNRQALEGLPLAKMHSVTIQARDGLDLICYYTLPVWHSHQETNRPTEPLPMVLVVHGGPWGRDHWGYNSQHQLLANRGYAVLSVNFRGSTGLGKSFINAANMEWGRKMHDDLIDAVNWAVEEGIADRERVAIMGGSYGGYATLAGLTFTPETFICGIDIVGPSNLNTLLQTVPEYWKPGLEMMLKRIGDYRTEEGQTLLKERSPLTYADRIQRPLLIAQGANDPRVKQDESDQIVQAMQEKNIPVTYVLYPDEGHGFARPENNLSFTAIAEAFLARCMEEERYEPIGDSFEGSSLTVPTGAGDVPGLVEALSP